MNNRIETSNCQDGESQSISPMLAYQLCHSNNLRVKLLRYLIVIVKNNNVTFSITAGCANHLRKNISCVFISGRIRFMFYLTILFKQLNYSNGRVILTSLEVTRRCEPRYEPGYLFKVRNPVFLTLQPPTAVSYFKIVQILQLFLLKAKCREKSAYKNKINTVNCLMSFTSWTTVDLTTTFLFLFFEIQFSW